MIAPNKPQLVFEGGFDEREAAECQARGYRSHVWAELPSGERYALVFYDAVRLAQDLEDEVADGSPCISEPGLIVVQEVTIQNMQASIEQLADEGYFDALRPVGEMETTSKREAK